MTNYAPYSFLDRRKTSNILIQCDHATNYVPPFVNGGHLGVSSADMQRHIAYDVGAAGVSVALGEILGASVIMSNFSRLVIDPNRGEDDPTLIMQIYDGSVIPANRNLTDAQRQERLDRCYLAYHNKVAEVLSDWHNPAIISIHSFTPQLQGKTPRPWHVGVLFAEDERLARPFINHVEPMHGICLGENEPYSGSLPGDSMDRHGLKHGRNHVLIELRNDLIESHEGQKSWAQLLAPAIQSAVNEALQN